MDEDRPRAGRLPMAPYVSGLSFHSNSRPPALGAGQPKNVAEHTASFSPRNVNVQLRWRSVFSNRLGKSESRFENAVVVGRGSCRAVTRQSQLSNLKSQMGTAAARQEPRPAWHRVLEHGSQPGLGAAFTSSTTFPIGPWANRANAAGNCSNGKTRSTRGRAPLRPSRCSTSCQAVRLSALA